MNRSARFAIVGLAACTTIACSLAFAQQNPRDNKPTAPKPPAATTPSKPATPAKPSAPTAPPHGEMQLPPGMTEADMMACMEAGTPGEQHAFLAEAVGTWKGKTKMWMAPGVEPMTSECMSTVSTMMDGRFTKCEITGDMPGMGPFNGFGIYGYDNVAQQFQSTWIDNCGTGMMMGTGQLSSDKKTMTWNFTYHCPITKKATKMREIERITGKDTKVMEMHGVDPKSGQEYKMMEIAFTRVSNEATAAASTN